MAPAPLKRPRPKDTPIEPWEVRRLKYLRATNRPENALEYEQLRARCQQLKALGAIPKRSQC